MGSVLTGVTDVESATAALPKLAEMKGKLGSLDALLKLLPALAKPSMVETLKTSIGRLDETRKPVEGIPGVGDILKSILNQIFEKFSSMLKL